MLLEELKNDQDMTLSDQIFQTIQAAIVSGEIPAGKKISEPELARMYGISRGPLREAIRRLEGQKLVERTAHVGARVVSLSHQQLYELYQIRENLEGLACRLAAKRIDKQQILALRDVLKNMPKMMLLRLAKVITCRKVRMIFIIALSKIAAIKRWKKCYVMSYIT